MPENPLVSIITPSYNAEKYLVQTIESVRKQSYQNWEMLIVDDYSVDRTLQIIESYCKKDDRIKLIRLESNQGATKARNRAIKEAQGRYIAFLDSDDIWFPEKLEKQMSFLQQNDLVLSYSAYETIDAHTHYINTRNVPPVLTYEDMLKSNHIGNLTGIYDTNFFGKVYLKNQGHEDYILWLELMKQIESTQGIQEPLAQYRITGTSLSSNKFKAMQWQWHIYRDVEKLGFLQSVYYFSWYIYYSLKKRKK